MKWISGTFNWKYKFLWCIWKLLSWFFIRTLVNLKRYIIKSNRETGKGRSDIIIKYPNRRGAAVILELKVAKSFKEMSDKCDEALSQIEENSMMQNW